MTFQQTLVLPFLLMALAISGPAIRFAAAPALAVVLWRLVLSLPVLASIALCRRRRWPLLRGAAAGLFLAGHWVCWVLAVQTTVLASASILISTGALWAAVLSRPLLHEPVSRRQWFGLGLALLGVGLIMAGSRSGRHSLSGDLLALLGALAWVGYSFIGRRARQQADFWSYTTTVYGAALGVVLVAALVRGVPLTGYSARTWLALATVAVFPTLIGHGSFNYLLRYLGPARLGLWTLSEPVLATLIAWPLFGEVPGARVVAGGLCALVGVGLGVTERGGVAGRDAVAT